MCNGLGSFHSRMVLCISPITVAASALGLSVSSYSALSSAVFYSSLVYSGVSDVVTNSTTQGRSPSASAAATVAGRAAYCPKSSLVPFSGRFGGVVESLPIALTAVVVGSRKGEVIARPRSYAGLQVTPCFRETSVG